MNANEFSTIDLSLLQRESGFAIGDRVYLTGARFGAAGKVMRWERGKVVVSWSDLNLITRHRPETLRLADEGDTR